MVAELARVGATSALRGGVLAVAAAVSWWVITVPAGVAAAAFAAFAAALSADAVATGATRLRTRAVLGGGALVAGLGVWLARSVIHADVVAEAIGSVAAVHVSEVLRALLLTGAVVFVVRFLAARHASTAPLEVGLVAAAFVAAVAAHREGMIHRPLPLGDFAWAHGIDPTLLLLGLGILCAVLLAALLLREARRGRIALHLGALGLLILLLVLGVRVAGLPTPRPPQELGLTGEGNEEEELAGGGSRSRQSENQFEFRDEYDQERGRAPVAVVVLHDEYDPPEGAYYFRQSALSRYNGRRLVQATRDDVDTDIVARFPNAPIGVDWSPPGADEREVVRTTTGMLVEHTKPFAIDAPVTLQPVGREDPRFKRVYESLSLVREGELEVMLGDRPGDARWSDEQLAYYTQVPDDPRYREIADETLEILRPEYRDDPLARALAVKMHLDETGTYSLKSGHAGAEDPVASFLFGDRTGYCVHFSHAAVYLMRSLGVPARVATGYSVPAEDRGAGSSIMVRGLNAHAWPEIYLADAGWVVVDLSPERVLDQLAAAPDQTLQMMLGQMLRDGSRDTEWEAPPPPFDLMRIVWGASALAVLALLSGFAVKWGRWIAPRFASEASLGRVAYRAALDRLAAAGLRRRYGEGREGFAVRVAEAVPAFGGLTRVHVASAWGRRPAGARDEVMARVASVSRELRDATPAWRRALGAINPYSWLLSR